MFNVNTITVAGFLGADPETRFGQSGTAVAKLRVGVSQRSTQNQDNPTMWLTVKCFGRQAEFAGKELHKGDAVCITGKLTEEHWTKQDQTPMKAIVINADLVYKDRISGQSNGTQPTAAAQPPASAPRRGAPATNGAPRVPVAPPSPAAPEAIDLDDSVPF
jgi:single-strand DNA-binding protein